MEFVPDAHSESACLQPQTRSVADLGSGAELGPGCGTWAGWSAGVPSARSEARAEALAAQPEGRDATLPRGADL